MSINGNGPTRSQDIAGFVGRGLFAALFLMALAFKLLDPASTAKQIAGAGFPAAGVLTYLAAAFEGLLVNSLLTGFKFRAACVGAAAYVIFLAFTFHGPSNWSKNPDEFGFFVDHFTFVAGLAFAFANGPGRWVLVRERSRRVAGASAPHRVTGNQKHLIDQGKQKCIE